MEKDKVNKVNGKIWRWSILAISKYEPLPKQTLSLLRNNILHFFVELYRVN